MRWSDASVLGNWNGNSDGGRWGERGSGGAADIKALNIRLDCTVHICSRAKGNRLNLYRFIQANSCYVAYMFVTN